MIKLYGVGFSRSFRTLWAAEEAGVDYEFINVNFGSKDEHGSLSELYQSLNGQGKVPTMLDGDFVLTESAAIVNYLGNKSTEKRLLPLDGTEKRAKYDEMSFFILSELEQGLWTNGKHRFALPEEWRVPEVLTKTAPFEFAKAQKTLLALKGTNTYAIGESFTMADVLLAHTISWAERFEFEVAPALITYRNNMIQRSAFKRAAAKVPQS
ncbi:MAG: glutathione S-transferase family protein [Thalassotalea sp.]